VDTSLEELPQIISEPYHPPPPGKEERHHGVDFSYYRRGERLTIQGSGVQAVLPGVVSLALQDKFPYGNVVIIETPQADLPAPLIELVGIQEGQSIYTLYAHLESAPLVNAGERVEACRTLGAVGKSGNAGVAHLHLEMRRGPAGSTLTTMSYYILEATAEEKASYLRWRTSGEFNHFDPMVVLFP
jgi:murein DD-endopeptidase MepM/ murein hydrolase activator NlpD